MARKPLRPDYIKLAFALGQKHAQDKIIKHPGEDPEYLTVCSSAREDLLFRRDSSSLYNAWYDGRNGLPAPRVPSPFERD